MSIIQYIHDLETPTEVTTCFWFGIQSWLNNTVPPPILAIVPNAGTQLQQAYSDQHTIGWRHVLRGRLATQWYIVIHQEIEARVSRPKGPKYKFQSPELWGRKILHTCWKQIIQMLEGRNNAVQKLYVDKGLNRAHELLVKAAVQEIRDIQIKAHISGRDAHWLDKSEAELRAMHPLSLQFWFQNITKMKQWYKSTL